MRNVGMVSNFIPPPIMPRLKREDGQTVAEYALVLGVVSLVLIGVLVASGLTEDFQELVEAIVDLLFPE
jgi:Flp pilus assembly pilin Flp